MNIQNTIAKVATSRHYEVAKQTTMPIGFFLFPETYKNPLPKWAWFPYLAMFFRIWMYGLVLHHLEELKSIMELIPFL